MQGGTRRRALGKVEIGLGQNLLIGCKQELTLWAQKHSNSLLSAYPIWVMTANGYDRWSVAILVQSKRRPSQ
jgi:hypothetical protein